MIVYADVLIFLNIIIDYLLLSLCSVVISEKPKLKRIIFGSVLGGISSLIIFLPKLNLLLEAILSIFVAVVIIFATYGKIPLKRFLKGVLTLYFSSFLLAGGLLLLSRALKLTNIAINNSIIYLNISPIILLVSTAIFYISFFLFSKIFKSNADFYGLCEVELVYKDLKIEEKGIIDSGNSMIDYFSNSEIIFVDASIFDLLIINEESKNRFRVIPCATVTGSELLNGIRIDKAKVRVKKRVITLIKPIIVKSQANLPEEYKCILNPQILS